MIQPLKIFGNGAMVNRKISSQVSLLLAAVLFISSPASMAISDDESRSLAIDIKNTFETKGSDALVRYLRGRAEQGLDLNPLRQSILMHHSNKPESIEVRVHPQMLA